MPATATRPSLGVAYQPAAAVDRHALLAEGLDCIVNGRPFPAALAPADLPCRPATSCAEGIARILGNA